MERWEIAKAEFERAQMPLMHGSERDPQEVWECVIGVVDASHVDSPVDAPDDVKWAIDDERAKVIVYLRALRYDHAAEAIASGAHTRPRQGVGSTGYQVAVESCGRLLGDDRVRCTDGPIL